MALQLVADSVACREGFAPAEFFAAETSLPPPSLLVFFSSRWEMEHHS